MSIARSEIPMKSPCGRFTAALGRLLAVGIILAPLVVMLFPERSHHAEGRSPPSTQGAAARTSTADHLFDTAILGRAAK